VPVPVDVLAGSLPPWEATHIRGGLNRSGHPLDLSGDGSDRMTKVELPLALGPGSRRGSVMSGPSPRVAVRMRWRPSSCSRLVGYFLLSISAATR
jgi:hypothetical protein